MHVLTAFECLHLRLHSRACVCVLCANAVIAGGNQIGCDLGWQVLRAVVITPVSVNHISLYVLSHTLPT